MKRKNVLKRQGLPAAIASITLIALLAVLLSGCAPKSRTDSLDHSGAADTSGDISEEDTSFQGDTSSEGEPDSAEPTLEPTLPDGFFEMEQIDITSEEGNEISRMSEEMERSYRAGPDSPLIKQRDWSIYTSELAKKSMTSEEAAYYDRLDQLCRRYIESPALNGVERTGSENQILYAADKVFFHDLSLTTDRAAAVYWWFKYNNPQYYFLNGVTFRSTDYLIPTIYKFAANGETRIKLTNELFDKLDLWIASLRRAAGTVWQLELLANNMLCKEFIYDNSLKSGSPNSWRGQNIYSAVMERNTVCAGYAQTFSAIMNACGVKTVVALSHNHAWNVVDFQGENYYAMDVCWNDNEYDDNKPYNKYVNAGETTLLKADKKSDKESHTYREDTSAWTPAIVQSDYSPTAYDQAEKPAAPANVTISKVGSERIKITWEPVAGASGYQERWFTDASYQQPLGSTEIKSHTPDQLNYEWVAMKNGRTYYHGIRTVKTVDGKEIYSDWTTSVYTHTDTSATHTDTPSEITPDLFFNP